MKQQLAVVFRFTGSFERTLGDIQHRLFASLGERSCKALPPFIPLYAPREPPEPAADFPVGIEFRLRAPIVTPGGIVMPVEFDPRVTQWCATRQTSPGDGLVCPGAHVLLCLATPETVSVESQLPADALSQTAPMSVRSGSIQLLQLHYELGGDGSPTTVWWRVLWSVPSRSGRAMTARLRPDSLAE